MRLSSETAQRVKRAGLRAMTFAVGVTIGVAFCVVALDMPMAVAAYGWLLAIGGFAQGHYRGETATVERIRSYLHRENR